MNHRVSKSLFVLSLLAAAGCPSGAPSGATSGPAAMSPTPPTSAIAARYVLLSSSPAGDTVAFARAIVTGGAPGCPAVQATARIAMTPRANPHGFEVAVCEALVPFEQPLALITADGSLPLPTIKRDPRHVLVLGDTGCKASDCPAGTPAQPFAAMAAAAATPPPDLILHMGDYNYRGTGSKITVTDAAGNTTQEWSYDAGDGTELTQDCTQSPGSGFFSQNAPGSSPPDAWASWLDDLFAPAGELLSAAPWVFARGNHELCSRAGPGWFYFLDPSSALPEGGGAQRACPTPDPSKDPIDNVVLTPPYRVELASLRVIVVDSANACDSLATPGTQAFTDAYTAELARVAELAAGKQGSWLMTHRPTWGVTSLEAGQTTPCTPAAGVACINVTLQAALAARGGALPAEIALSLAGHMHQFQALTFDGGRPPQLAIGNGGVALEASGPQGVFTATVAGAPTRGLTLGANVNTTSGPVAPYGMLSITIEPGGRWSGTLHNPATKTELATCGSDRAGGAVCTATVEVSTGP